MFREYEFVELTEDLDNTLIVGTRGVIVMIYNSFPKEYEVEFVDDDNNTIGLTTVKEFQIKKVVNNE